MDVHWCSNKKAAKDYSRPEKKAVEKIELNRGSHIFGRRSLIYYHGVFALFITFIRNVVVFDFFCVFQ